MSALEELLSTVSLLPADNHDRGMSAEMSAEPTLGQQASTQSMEGNRLPCSFYGCKQTFTDMQKLTNHTQSHQIFTQSLPGKAFHCSTLDCNYSFPSMQQLMEHVRHHYKPNHYFLCESCRAKLRSHGALFKHLHTCAKVAKSKAAKAEELNSSLHSNEATQSASMPSNTPTDEPPPEGPSEHTGSLQSSAEVQIKLESPPPCTIMPAHPDFPPAPLGPFSVLKSPSLTGPVQGFSTQPQPESHPSHFPGYLTSLSSSGPGQQRSLQAIIPTPGSPTSPGSNAIWRKNQDAPELLLHRRNSPPSSQSINTGQSFSSRILWEHTRGRYRCLQCGHSTPTRQEMTAHIEGQHRGPVNRLHSDMDFRAFQAKNASDSEHCFYTQL